MKGQIELYPKFPNNCLTVEEKSRRKPKRWISHNGELNPVMLNATLYATAVVFSFSVSIFSSRFVISNLSYEIMIIEFFVEVFIQRL